jgi:hypothetical protein
MEAIFEGSQSREERVLFLILLLLFVLIVLVLVVRLGMRRRIYAEYSYE